MGYHQKENYYPKFLFYFWRRLLRNYFHLFTTKVKEEEDEEMIVWYMKRHASPIILFEI